MSRRITTRDYKRPARRTLSADLKELKPYLLGALAGAALVFGGMLYMQQRNRPPAGIELSGQPIAVSRRRDC